jgi:hypothetical protein
MPGITKATQGDIDSARCESKKEVTPGDNNDGVRAAELLKLVMVRLFAIIDDINSEWPEGIKILNSLTTGAPIASILCNNEWRAINGLAFKLRDGNSGHQAVTDIYGHPEFPDGDGHTCADLAAAAGLESVLSLASAVLCRLLGQRGILYEDITPYPKSAFLFAALKLLDSHYLVGAQSVDDLRDNWRDSKHVTRSDMRSYLGATEKMVRQINIDAKHIVPAQPLITPRDQMRHLCKNTDTKTDSTFDNTLSKANDTLSGAKVTKRDVDKIRNERIRHADKKFPDTNFLPTAPSSITNDPRGNASVYMASQFANSNANLQMMGAGDAAAVDGTDTARSCLLRPVNKWQLATTASAWPLHGHVDC